MPDSVNDNKNHGDQQPAALEQRVNRLENALSEMAANVKALSESVKDTHNDMRDQYNRLFSRFDDLVTDIHSRGRASPQLLFGLLSTGAICVSGLAAFVLLHTAPIQREVASHGRFVESRIQALHADYFTLGTMRTQVDQLDTRTDRLVEHVEDLRVATARLEERSAIHSRDILTVSGRVCEVSSELRTFAR